MTTKVRDGLNKLATELGMSVTDLKLEVWGEVRDDFAREDIDAWLDYRNKTCTKEQKDKILDAYFRHHNAELGTWDNIESAYYYVVGYGD